MMKEPSIRVLILGAGYAGLMAAVRLAGKTRRKHVQITLLNGDQRFVERPKLHETAVSGRVSRYPLAKFLAGTGVKFEPGWVTRLLPDLQQVEIETRAGQRRLGYDFLVYALGSTLETERIPGAAAHAFTLVPDGPRSAAALAEKLASLPGKDQAVTVVGAGPTGIETAAEIASAYPQLQVSLVTRGKFGGFTSARVQQVMRQAMGRLGVTIHEHRQVVAVEPEILVTRQGERLPFDICVWAAGFAIPPLARRAGLAVNERGQILVDHALRSLSHPRILAAGDAAWPAQPAGAPVRMGIFPAMVMGGHAANSLARQFNGRSPRPLGFSYYGQGIALGRRDAVGFLTFPDGAPVGPLVTGRAGLAVRNFFVWLLRTFLRLERYLPGIFFWFGGRRGQAHPRSASEALKHSV